MAMTMIVSGKMFNGGTHAWKDSKKEQRTMFRGRLNYRDRTNGEWYWIDAVCWKDFGDTDGLVGFLEKHFSMDSDNAPGEKGGQPIEVVGYLRPTEKLHTVPMNGKKNGKPVTIEVPNVAYPTFEFVIETVDFPPSVESGKRKSSKVTDSDLDFDDIDEDEITAGAVEEEDEIEVEVETPKKETATQKKARLAKEAKAKASAKSRKETVPASDDDDEAFFED